MAIQTLEDKEDKLHTTQEIEGDQWRDHRLRLPQISSNLKGGHFIA